MLSVEHIKECVEIVYNQFQDKLSECYLAFPGRLCYRHAYILYSANGMQTLQIYEKDLTIVEEINEDMLLNGMCIIYVKSMPFSFFSWEPLDKDYSIFSFAHDRSALGITYPCNPPVSFNQQNYSTDLKIALKSIKFIGENK